MKRLFCLLVLVTSCGISQQNNVSLVVLGTVQDGGSPHIGCEKECCSPLWKHPDPTRKVVSLGIIDYENKKTFLFEATPDLPEQLKLLKKVSNLDTETPDGIFLTHAHMGHYTGLMFLGREALGSKNVPVYTMPKMESFLKENGPWNQLIKLNNIALKSLHKQQIVSLTPNISVVNKELNYRDISEIPHPFVIESLELFKNLSNKEKSKIHFIHFNHTNPLLTPNSPETKHTILEGFRIAKFKQVIGL